MRCIHPLHTPRHPHPHHTLYSFALLHILVIHSRHAHTHLRLHGHTQVHTHPRPNTPTIHHPTHPSTHLPTRPHTHVPSCPDTLPIHLPNQPSFPDPPAFPPHYHTRIQQVQWSPLNKWPSRQKSPKAHNIVPIDTFKSHTYFSFERKKHLTPAIVYSLFAVIIGRTS